MNDKYLQIGEAQEIYNASYSRVLRYTVEISHSGLNEHKILSAPELDLLQNKANLQASKWIEKWAKLESRKANLEQKEANKEEALERTEDAKSKIEEIENLLKHTLDIDDTVDWETLKKKEQFQEKIPSKPAKRRLENYVRKPEKNDSAFIPSFTFFEKIISSKKLAKISHYENLFESALKKWEEMKNEVDKRNEETNKKFQESISAWEKNVEEFEKRKQDFYTEQDKFNLKIEAMKDAYTNKNKDSIIEYCEIVLNNSSYPESFAKDFELEYDEETKILIVEYELPSFERFPRIKDVKYVQARNELVESYIPDNQLNKMFDEAMYKIALRTIHELFEADVINALDTISFNGWVNSINKATGKEENNCILSIQTRKEEFMEIDLSRIDPKSCFRNLKGVASSKLSSLTPIQPIMQISRTDKRFVPSYDVTGEIDNSTNLAAMDWEDFEHLIRELFQKEFSANGGEVKVTQASRDGGVDAIAFDPDPIRGGKIVIQAKRYTNTVGVSAVRDLYGTVMNEGATKGILVTTANYGPDAYDFAKGKPITLLSGSNLLHLLEKHGTHAKIDLREAKQIIQENKSNF